MKTFWKITLIAALLIAVLGFTGYAYASSTGVGMRDLLSGNFRMNRAGTMQPVGMAMMGNGEGALHEYMDDAWAQVLGLTVEEMEDKLAQGLTHYDIALEQGKTADEFEGLMKAAMTIAVGAAVQDGALTQEQAQRMLQHMNQMQHSGGMTTGGTMHQGMHADGGLTAPGAGSMEMRGGPGMLGMTEDRFVVLASFLGLSVDEVQARIENGSTIAEVLSAEGKTIDQWLAFSLEEHTRLINEAVANGELSQEQADAILLRLRERIENGWGEPFGAMGPLGEPGEFGPGMMGPGGHGTGSHHGPNH